MIFDGQACYSANMQMLSEALRYAEELEAQLGDGSVGLVMSKQMFEFICDNSGIFATYDPTVCSGRYRCSGFDVYPILDGRTTGPYVVPIVTAERFGGNIRYGTGTLIMRDGMIYQVTEVHPPYGFGLARTGLHISVDGSFILPYGDVLIDDGVHNLEWGLYEKLLMDAPHNRLFDEKKIGAVRVTNWEQVYDTVTRIGERKTKELMDFLMAKHV